jgi:hypothetical protein
VVASASTGFGGCARNAKELQMKIALGKFKVSRNNRADVFRNEKKNAQGKAKQKWWMRWDTVALVNCIN